MLISGVNASLLLEHTWSHAFKTQTTQMICWNAKRVIRLQVWQSHCLIKLCKMRISAAIICASNNARQSLWYLFVHGACPEWNAANPSHPAYKHETKRSTDMQYCLSFRWGTPERTGKPGLWGWYTHGNSWRVSLQTILSRDKAQLSSDAVPTRDFKTGRAISNKRFKGKFTIKCV